MELGLTGRTAIVTGASKGIGLAIVRALVSEGVHVIAGARSSSAGLDELAADGAVDVVGIDLSDPDAPAALVASTTRPIDVLVNNVGLATARTEGFLAVTDEQWVASLNLNLLAAVRAARAVLPGMIAAGSGVIVNVASVNAYLPDPAVIDYSAAKAGLANFAKSLSKEMGPHGIRVNSVNPGPVRTGLWLGDGGIASTVSGKTGLTREQVQDGAVADAATRRFSTPEEVADLVVFLASDRAANITGAGYAIDGGLVQTL